MIGDNSRPDTKVAMFRHFVGDAPESVPPRVSPSEWAIIAPMARGENGDGLYDKLYGLLPDYACGMIWTVDIVWLIAFNISVTQAVSFARSIARLLQPFNIPEFAIGFLVAVAGVLLPFAVARALNPLTIAILNVIWRRWRRANSDAYVGPEHVRLAAERLAHTLRIAPPRTAWPILFMQYLRHTSSPTIPNLAESYKAIHERIFLAFPVSTLLGLLIFSALGPSITAAVVAGAVTLATLVAAIHRSHGALAEWNSSVLLAFLVATTPTDAVARTPEAPAPAG
jgi:hypothetical protein